MPSRAVEIINVTHHHVHPPPSQALQLERAAASSGTTQLAATRPNILFAIADAWPFPHRRYGDRAVRRRVDRIAGEGALFLNAFTAAPPRTPSRPRSTMGQAVHRLAEGGNLTISSRDSPRIRTSSKGRLSRRLHRRLGPGQFEPGGRSRTPAGPQFKQFDEFLVKRRAGQPFAFWFGSNDPHLPYEAGSGAKAGLRADTVGVPGFFPDRPEVRSDLLDYRLEVQRFDRRLPPSSPTLEKAGELDNTIVVVTSDNGMPFPRAQANLYDAGTHMPLAIRWPRRIPAGTRVQPFVGHADIAPTLLEAAGLAIPSGMTGQSAPRWRRSRSGARRRARPRVHRARTPRQRAPRRSQLSACAIRTADHLYIRNDRPDRWPAGDPDLYVAVGPFGDIDDGPTKQLLLSGRDDPSIKRYFDLAVAKRPAEELFDLKKDPGQLTNVAGDPAYAAVRDRLKKKLDGWQRTTADPRATEDDDRWDRYPYYGAPAKK